MTNNLYIINIEEGRPTADVAIKKLSSEIVRVKAQGARVVKIIHGYGSSGVGGVLKKVVRRELERMIKRGVIRLYVPGESFEIFYPDAIKLLDNCNALRTDRDLGRYNSGITMALI
ncbi:MAG: Smr/MutS family protein [Acetivibrionales bacterium]|jgi:hypothetical protein